MPSRRSFLAGTGTVAMTALAGCTVLGNTDGSTAEVRPGRDLRPTDVTVVARASADGTGCPDGDVELQAIAFQPRETVLQILTKIDIFAGQTDCDSDWTHDDIHVTHDWNKLGVETESAVTDTVTNVFYTDTGGDVRLQKTGNSDQGEWRVHRTADGGETEQYNFRSTYTFGDLAGEDRSRVSKGDELGTVKAKVSFSTGGLLGGKSKTVTQMETLVFGQTEDDA